MRTIVRIATIGQPIPQAVGPVGSRTEFRGCSISSIPPKDISYHLHACAFDGCASRATPQLGNPEHARHGLFVEKLFRSRRTTSSETERREGRGKGRPSCKKSHLVWGARFTGTVEASWKRCEAGPCRSFCFVPPLSAGSRAALVFY